MKISTDRQKSKKRASIINQIKVNSDAILVVKYDDGDLGLGTLENGVYRMKIKLNKSIFFTYINLARFNDRFGSIRTREFCQAISTI